MNKFSEAIQSGKFVVTGELTPPKGINLKSLFKKAEIARGLLDAINLTDCHTSRMTMSPIAVAHLLIDRGFEPILQVTGRDRNRLAVQSDLLGAYALGIENIVLMTGDHPRVGDHPDAKPVFDLDGISLLQTASVLNSGKDLGGNMLNQASNFFIGAVVNPGAPNLDKEIQRMDQKIEAGARFFQTQAVYDPASFEIFMSRVQKYRVAIIAGFITLKSAKMARIFNKKIPGVHVPEDIIKELESTGNESEKSVEIAGRIIGELRHMCQGVHIMPVGAQSRIPQVLEAAGII